MASSSLDHDRVRKAIEELLARAEAAGLGERFGASEIVVDVQGRRREPDLFFARVGRLHLASDRAFQGAPDLVVEVLSPSTRDEDLPGGEKGRDYEQLGIPHYWIADPRTRRIAQYVHQEGRYGQPTILGREDTLASPLFPAIAAAVSQVFASVKQPERPPRGLGHFRILDRA